MARADDPPDRWARLLAPAERGAALIAKSLRDPVEPLGPSRRRQRLWHRVLRLVRRVRRRLHL